MSTSSAPRQPIRATPSLTLARGPPALAPADKTYTPLIRTALAYRVQTNVLFPSAAFCWILSIILSSNVFSLGGTPSTGTNASKQGFGIKRALLSPFRPQTLGLSIVVFLILILPVLVLRKNTIDVAPARQSSPRNTFRAVIKSKEVKKAGLTYAGSMLLMLGLHYLLAYTGYVAGRNEDPKIAVFGRSKKHPLHLNGRFLFLVLSHFTLAGVYTTRNALRDRLAVRWFASSAPALLDTLATQLPTTLISAVFLSTLSLGLSTTVFAVLRSVVLRILLRIPVLNAIIRPFIGAFLRARAGSTPMLLMKHSDLLIRSFGLSVATTSGWEFVEGLFETFIPRPITISPFTPTPALTLLSGTLAPETHLRHLAITELAELCSAPPGDSRAKEGRESVFHDQAHNPTAWNVLVRQSLLVLGQDFATLRRRGTPKPSAPVATIKASPPPANTLPKPTSLLKAPIFRASPSTPVETVLNTVNSGVLTAAVTEVEHKIESAVHMPEIFRSSVIRPVEKAVLSIEGKVEEKVEEGKELVVQSVQEAKSLEGKVVGMMPPFVGEVVERLKIWWERERVDRRVETSLPRRDVDVSIVQILSYMIAASLEEDRYGVVKKDVPRVMEALVKFMKELDVYRAELMGEADKLLGQSSDGGTETRERKEEYGRAIGMVGALADETKEAISRVLRRFGEKMVAFRFDPVTAGVLDGFMMIS